MTKPRKPIISNDFTIEDIHKIREHNHEMTKDMSFEKRKVYYSEGAKPALERIAKLKEELEAKTKE
jgi:hypothetical protein